MRCYAGVLVHKGQICIDEIISILIQIFPPPKKNINSCRIRGLWVRCFIHCAMRLHSLIFNMNMFAKLESLIPFLPPSIPSLSLNPPIQYQIYTFIRHGQT